MILRHSLQALLSFTLVNIVEKKENNYLSQFLHSFTVLTLSFYFYEPITIATMKLLLRRTLVRLVILIITFHVHNYSQLFIRLTFQYVAPTEL